MKNSIKSLLLTLAMLSAYSCNPDLVDEDPLFPTEQDYFADLNEFRSQLTGVYATLYDYYHFSAPAFQANNWIAGTWLLPGDDLTENQGNRTAVELFDGGLNPNNNRVGFVFTASYKMIGRANVTIDKVRTVDFSTYEGADEIAGMEGEALFLRAYAYFKLFNVFGSVPIVNERIQSEQDSNTPKSPAIDVLSQVIDDARDAIAFVPEEWDDANAGRVTKNAARGLLAKALVFRANYTGNDADYTEALNVFNSINATLVPDFINNFSSFAENNEESLFEVQAARPSAGNNLILHHDGPWRGVENMSVYRGYMMEFSGKGNFNDAAATKFFATDKLLNNFGQDPRISVFINPEDGFDGRIFQKYNKPDSVHVVDDFANHGGSLNNERVLRYADLKLLAAEAALMTGDPTSAIGHINDVRTRAREWAVAFGYGDGSIPADRPTGVSDEATIMQWIMDERYVELAGEGQRWWDMKRWHVAGAMDLSGWDGSDDDFSTELQSPVQFDVNTHLVFPLPQSEIERNSAITENNPGY